MHKLSNIVTASYELIFHLITMQILRYSFSKYYDCQTIQRFKNTFFRLDLSHAVEAKGGIFKGIKKMSYQNKNIQLISPQCAYYKIILVFKYKP